MDWGLNVLGIMSLMATVVIAFGIFRLQGRSDARWQGLDSSWKSEMRDLTHQVDEGVRLLAEQAAEKDAKDIQQDASIDDEGDSAAPGDSPSAAATLEPKDAAAYVEVLKAAGINVSYPDLKWARKVRGDGGRGNLGWFVEDSSGKRYFVHRGRGGTVRPALPRRFLEAWETASGRRPTEIELDYQTGVGRGNHAWYVRTYSGDTWKLSAGGQGKSGITVTKIDEGAEV